MFHLENEDVSNGSCYRNLHCDDMMADPPLYWQRRPDLDFIHGSQGGLSAPGRGGIADMEAVDIPVLKTQRVAGDERRVTYYGHIPDVSEHLAKVREEFVGLPELCYVHAE